MEQVCPEHMEGAMTRAEKVIAALNQAVEDFVANKFTRLLKMVVVLGTAFCLPLVDSLVYPLGDRWQDLLETPAHREVLRAEGRQWKADKAFLTAFGRPVETLCVNADTWEASLPEDRERFYLIMDRRGRQKANDAGCVRYPNSSTPLALHGWSG